MLFLQQRYLIVFKLFHKTQNVHTSFHTQFQTIIARLLKREVHGRKYIDAVSIYFYDSDNDFNRFL